MAKEMLSGIPRAKARAVLTRLIQRPLNIFSAHTVAKPSKDPKTNADDSTQVLLTDHGLPRAVLSHVTSHAAQFRQANNFISSTPRKKKWRFRNIKAFLKVSAPKEQKP